MEKRSDRGNTKICGIYTGVLILAISDKQYKLCGNKDYSWPIACHDSLKVWPPNSYTTLECNNQNIDFSDSIHRPGIKKQTKGNTTFRKLDLFPSSGAGKNLFCWVP
jgi:hypothetical protein